MEAGWPGRASDARVLNNSDFFKSLDNYINTGDRELINTYNVLGDAAFPCRKHLMVPYCNIQGQQLDRVRGNFNRCLASKRQVLIHSITIFGNF